MKECPSCRAKNRNEANFCTQCGSDLKDVPAQTDEWAAAAGDFLSKAKEAATVGAKKAKEAAVVGAQKAKEAATAGAEKAQKAMEEAEAKAAEKKSQQVSSGGWDSATEVQAPVAGSWADTAETGQPAGPGAPFSGGGKPSGGGMLVDQSETIVAAIGSNYLQNYLSGGSVSKGIGILTQKRFYYKGRNFSGSGKAVESTTTEGVVSLEDIAFTEFTHTRHIGFLFFAILLTIGAFTLYAAGGRSIGMIALVATLPFYILFFVKRQTLFLVSFPGGGFAFDIRWYPIADIRDFQRQLHLLKDHIKEENRA